MKAFYLGKREYIPVLRLQSIIFQSKISLLSARRRGTTSLPVLPDVNLLVEHRSPVYTLGRRDTSTGLSPLLQRTPIIDSTSFHEKSSSRWSSSGPTGAESVSQGSEKTIQRKEKSSLRSSPALIVKTKRGGGITYHGPGQVTMYPIAQLQLLWKECKDEKKPRSPIEWFSGVLEKAMQSTANCFGIPTHAFKTGIWADQFDATDARKLGSIGLQLGSNWVSMHGAALNVSPDLAYFDQIVICELPGCCATSIEEEIRLRNLCDKDFCHVMLSKGTAVKTKSDTLYEAAATTSSSVTPSVNVVASLLHHSFVQQLHHPSSNECEDITDLSSYPEDQWEQVVYESLSLSPPDASFSFSNALG